MKIPNRDPLTRPALAGESAVASHPLRQEGEGIFMTSGEPEDHEALARNDSPKEAFTKTLHAGGPSGVKAENTAPCGSARMDMRPTFSIFIGGISVFPPS